MEPKTSTSSRQKWRESFQKSKSQSSITTSRKSSLFEDETSDNELQEYLETLKKKSGIQNLWRGQSFDKVVKDEEDKTPDISISSSEDENLQDIDSFKGKDNNSDDDFRPNIVMLPAESLSIRDDQSEDSGALLHGVQLADLPLSDDEEKPSLNNESKSMSVSEPKDINVILNNLHLASDVETEDEVVEEIEDDLDEVLPSSYQHRTQEPIHSDKLYNVEYSSPEPTHSPRDRSTPTGCRSRNKAHSQSKSNTSIEHSYTMDFSTADDVSVIEEKTESTRSNSSRSSHRSRPSHRSRSSHKSRSHSSRSSLRQKSMSSQASESYSKSKSSPRSRSRKSQESRDKNKHLCDVSVQTGLDLGAPPSGLGVDMATVNQIFGMQYVDPSPIATHVVSAEALEAITAYNPAVVALTDMLKQQIRLVQQFIDANTRMYQAYTCNLNSQYRYTTLEDTLEFIRKNKPKTLSTKEALRQVNEEDS